MIQAVAVLAETLGLSGACAALGVPRSSLYRARQPERGLSHQPLPARMPSGRALTPAERQAVLQVLNSARFQDDAPREVYASLLDEGVYLCSWRTMYRLLDETDAVRERRNQLRHPSYTKPELLATSAKQLWSWDITKLRGPAKWGYYYLYVLLDVFSRYVVGWLIAEQESASLAESLIAESCAKQGILPGQLTIHADRGGAMKSKPVAHLMADLGVIKTHSRPHVSNDNPYSEAQFKTLKYRPGYPDRFGSLEDARAWARPFFHWYNQEHHHTGLALLTPATVHYGEAPTVQAQRLVILQAAYQTHPERFVRGRPKPADLPQAVWINKPKTAGESLAQTTAVLESEASLRG